MFVNQNEEARQTADHCVRKVPLLYYCILRRLTFSNVLDSARRFQWLAVGTILVSPSLLHDTDPAIVQQDSLFEGPLSSGIKRSSVGGLKSAAIIRMNARKISLKRRGR